MENRKIRNMDVMWNITSLLQKTENLQEALSESLKFTVSAIEAESGTIWFINKRDDRLHPMFSLGPNTAGMKTMSLALGEGIAGHVAKTKESVIIEDCSKKSEFSQKFDLKTGYQTKSMICVPLVNKYECIGCIQIINKLDGGMFDAHDMEICENLASIAAIAIDNSGFLCNWDTDKKVLMTVRGLTKSYVNGTNTVEVLKGIDIDIFENELLVILGASGCGKSTLLNILGGMDSCTTGEVKMGDLDISKADRYALTEYRRSGVGFVFQFYNLMPNLTAAENLRLIAELKEDSMSVDEALKLVGLEAKRDNYPSQLSGGQQQRVSIARAIIKKPKLILADEPTGALDFNTGRDVLILMENIVQSGNGTIVIITHNIEIAKMADRVIHMKQGRIADVTRNVHTVRAADLVW